MRIGELIQTLRARPYVAREDVEQLLDVAMRDGTLTAEERTALQEFVRDSADSFETPDLKTRLHGFLAVVDDDVRALAHRLERDDGVLDLEDVYDLHDSLTAHGRELDPNQSFSLRALMVGARMTSGAREVLGRELDEPSNVEATALPDGIAPDNPVALDVAPLRTRVPEFMGGSKLVPLDEAWALSPPYLDELRDVDGQSLARALDTAREERADRIGRGATTPIGSGLDRVMLEDGSLRVRAAHMALAGGDRATSDYAIQMAQVGQFEGFAVVLRVSDIFADDVRERYRERGLDNVYVVGCTGQGDFWSEDQGELDTAGNVRVPAPRRDRADTHDYESVYKERLARFYPDADPGAFAMMSAHERRDRFPDVLFRSVGAVHDRESHEILASAALARGRDVIACASHIEGGNLLVGSWPDGRAYALVGRDSLAVSRSILEGDLGREVSDQELRAFVAADLGVEPEAVHPVEQPGDFHLDMHMVPVNPGEVVLNDAYEAAALQVQWLREDVEAGRPPYPELDPLDDDNDDKIADYEKRMRKWSSFKDRVEERIVEIEAHAERVAPFEERARRDLEAAGLTVHRMAGAFHDGRYPTMNFLNLEHAQNRHGERFAILLGGDPRAEAYVTEKLNDEFDCGYSRLHFLDRRNTTSTLQDQGGISCRVKLEGEPL